MQSLRTPDDRFTNLPGYDFAPNYLTIADGEGGELRVHFVDEGPRDGVTVLMLHGEPSWSYLYRKMLPGVVAAGHRVLAPDLVGFGRSDKPTQREDYTYQRHVDWMADWLAAVNPENVVLFCQDWGGLIGLRLLVQFPQMFIGCVAANTFLPTGDEGGSEAFMKWQHFSQTVDPFPAGGIIKGATVEPLDADVIAAYDAPFPDESYKAGARQFPMLVPITADNPASEANRQAWQQLRKLQIPFLTAFSDQDPVTAGNERGFHKRIPGCEGQSHLTIEGAGHFLQEDKGEQLAAVINRFIEDNNLAGENG